MEWGNLPSVSAMESGQGKGRGTNAHCGNGVFYSYLSDINKEKAEKKLHFEDQA